VLDRIAVGYYGPNSTTQSYTKDTIRPTTSSRSVGDWEEGNPCRSKAGVSHRVIRTRSVLARRGARFEDAPPFKARNWRAPWQAENSGCAMDLYHDLIPVSFHLENPNASGPSTEPRPRPDTMKDTCRVGWEGVDRPGFVFQSAPMLAARRAKSRILPDRAVGGTAARDGGRIPVSVRDVDSALNDIVGNQYRRPQTVETLSRVDLRVMR